MNKIEFFMPMQPPTVTAQEKEIAVRNGKPIVYEACNLADARQKLTAHLSKHAPDRPMDGALQLLCLWQWQPGAGVQIQRYGRYRTQKPDTDNLQKLLKDCMTATGYWNDDAQVVDERCVKRWTAAPGIQPGIYICVQRIDERYDEEI